MIGPYLNALGILLGALAGLAVRKPLTARTQEFFKTALGVFTVYCGFRLVYQNIDWTLAAAPKQIALGLLAVMVGYWVGRLFRLQTISNRLGHHAATLLAAAQAHPPGAPAAGFVAASLLFCAAPLGILGGVMDGLQDYYYFLLLKALMDGLAMMSFVKTFRWPSALAAAPVYCFFNGLALTTQLGARPWLEAHKLIGPIGVAAGLVACVVALVILQVRRVELANYLPALAVAPALTYWLA